jgi:3-oxoadipate enol-lactonase
MSISLERQIGDAPVNGARIHYEAAGSGDAAVVFIHAGVADMRIWEPQIEVFARKYRTIRYDLRGFGQSPMPDGQYANRGDLFGLLKHLEVAKAALIGCSMGGATAIDFALEHPAMVSALVAVGAGASGFVPTESASFTYWGELVAAIQKGEVDRAREMEAAMWIDGTGRDASQIDPKYRERARELHRDNFKPERLLHPEQQLTPPAIGRLGEIKAPTLVLIGDRDAPELLKLASKLAGEVAGARLEVIRDAAHLPNLEHPAEFNRLVLEFLASARV